MARHPLTAQMSILLGGLLGLTMSACKPVKAVSSPDPSPDPGQIASVQPSPRPTPTVEPATADAQTVEQITAFLEEAQAGLLAHRSGTETTEATPTAEGLGGQLPVAPPLNETASKRVLTDSDPEVVSGNGLEGISELAVDASADPQPSEVTDPITPLIRALLAAASASDTPLKQHLTLAIVLGMSRPDQPFAAEGLSELTDGEQALVAAVHRQFQTLGRDLEAGGDVTTVLASLDELIGTVSAEQPFRIDRLALCTGVRDYGVIDPIEPPVFSPRERSGFIWYLELDGVQPVHDEKAGTWNYEFDLRLEMLTRDTGIPVIAPIEGTVRHTATAEVRDFYLRDLFQMPPDLQFDWYTAKLTVVERSSGSQAQRSTDLLWVPNLAAGDAHLQEHRAAVATD